MLEAFSPFLSVAWTPELEFNYVQLVLPNALLEEILHEKDKIYLYWSKNEGTILKSIVINEKFKFSGNPYEMN